MDLLNEKEVISVKELSSKLNLSMMTIRRDLQYMEEKGVLKKIHGGAVLIRKEDADSTFYERIEQFKKEKFAIGKAAASLIKQNDVVVFDAGTSPLAMIQSIPDELCFTAITSGLMTAVALSNKPNVNLIIIGGDIHKGSLSSTSTIALEQIKKFNVDIAFFSTEGVCVDEGTYELLLPLIDVKKMLRSMSKKVVLLADHSKFGKKSLSLSIPIDGIDIVVTDSKVEKVYADKIKERNIEMIIAK